MASEFTLQEPVVQSCPPVKPDAVSSFGVSTGLGFTSGFRQSQSGHPHTVHEHSSDTALTGSALSVRPSPPHTGHGTLIVPSPNVPVPLQFSHLPATGTSGTGAGTVATEVSPSAAEMSGVYVPTCGLGVQPAASRIATNSVVVVVFI